MGEIAKYYCDYCKRDFYQKVGEGKRESKAEPKSCHYCSSTKFRRTGTVGKWD